MASLFIEKVREDERVYFTSYGNSGLVEMKQPSYVKFDVPMHGTKGV